MPMHSVDELRRAEAQVGANLRRGEPRAGHGAAGREEAALNLRGGSRLDVQQAVELNLR